MIYDISQYIIPWRVLYELDGLSFDFVINQNGEVEFKYKINTMLQYLMLEFTCHIDPYKPLVACKVCGKYFRPIKRNAMYCEPRCGNRYAKRKQRVEDKENPDRPRKEPHLQWKKNKQQEISEEI